MFTDMIVEPKSLDHIFKKNASDLLRFVLRYTRKYFRKMERHHCRWRTVRFPRFLRFWLINWLIDWMVFYAVSAIFQPYNVFWAGSIFIMCHQMAHLFSAASSEGWLYLIFFLNQQGILRYYYNHANRSPELLFLC